MIEIQKYFSKWNLKKDIGIYIAGGIVFTILICWMLPKLIDRTHLIYQTVESNVSENLTTVEIADKDNEIVIKQTFLPLYRNLKGIGIKMATYGKAHSGTVYMELWDETEQECLETVGQSLAVIKDGEYTEFPLSVNLDVSHQFSFRLRVDAQTDNPLGVYTIEESTYENGILYLEDKASGQGLCFSQIGYHEGCESKKILWIVTAVFMVCMMLMIREGCCHGKYDSITGMDYLFVGIAVLASAFLINQGWDVGITIRHARDLLTTIRQGNFGSFYSVVLDKALNGGYGQGTIQDAAVYNIVLYLLVMIIMLPCWLVERITGMNFGETVQLQYFNVFLILAFCCSVYLVYRIALDMGIADKQSRRVAYLYASSMLLLFATLGFCQLDLFYMLVVLLAVRDYLKKRFIRFSIWMSFAIMLKSFPIIIFIPLILLVEKRIAHIIKYMGIGVAFTLVNALTFGREEGYAFSNHELNTLYDFAGRLFRNGMNVGIGFGALFVLIMVILCVWCFDRTYRETELWKYVIVVPLTAFGAFFCLVYWHPQWFTMIMPFVALACGIDTKRRSLIYCEWGTSIMVCLLSAVYNSGYVDNYMVNNGVLSLLTGHTYTGISFGIILQQLHAYIPTAIASVLVALLGYFCYCSVRDIMKMQKVTDCENIYVERGIVLIRMASMYMLCLVYSIMFFYVG